MSVCLISADGTDCPIQEPYPFDTGIFSEKLNGPGLKYEVGVCIATGHIVWINGPYKAGKNDVTIFAEEGLLDALADDECVEVDAGYQGHQEMRHPRISQSRRDRQQKSRVRARHENVNSYLKKFSVLDDVFRHNVNLMERHKICFTAVAVITQLRFELHQSLYSVEYEVNY